MGGGAIMAIGRASFHIFLTQQVYFLTNIEKRIISHLGYSWALVIDIFVCIVVGYLFYYLTEELLVSKAWLFYNKAKRLN